MNKKFIELKNLPEDEINKKIENIKLELIKAKVTISKGGKVKMKELKKTLARLLMLKSWKKNSKEVEKKS
ncbi:MAG: 50S ribosomal protein L29 [Candidatus Pacearchaeota archaeon]